LRILNIALIEPLVGAISIEGLRLCGSLRWSLHQRLQQGLVGLTPFQLREGLVEDARQRQRAVWLLQVILVPIMDNSANETVLERGSIQHGGELPIQDLILSALIQLLPKVFVLLFGGIGLVPQLLLEVERCLHLRMLL
jgi:hypothetical protein